MGMGNVDSNVHGTRHDGLRARVHNVRRLRGGRTALRGLGIAMYIILS